MRGAVVYRVYGFHEGREKDFYFGAFRSFSEANLEIAKLSEKEMNGSNWATLSQPGLCRSRSNC